MLPPENDEDSTTRPDATTDAAIADAAAQLRTRGFALLEGVYDAATCALLKDALDGLRAGLGDPPLYAKDPIYPAPKSEISTTGLVFYELFGWRPDLAGRVFDPVGLGAIRAILGEGLHLELVGGVISDEGRPYFEWHTHLGGIDDERWRHAHRFPRYARSHRVQYLLYPEAVTEATGPLLVHPRRVGDPTEPPHPIDQTRWPGDVKLTFPAGSVLLLEQCVWHAVLPRQAPGLRYFVGGYFASAEAPPTELVDESLQTLQTDDPLLSSVLPGR